MKILKLNTTNQDEVISAAKEALAAGGLVIFPTETIYGAGVDATNQNAVDKLLTYKSRREGKPMSIAVTDEAMAREYVQVNEQARTIYSKFLPGPVTVVSESLGRVAEGVASETGTLGVRIPDYPLIIEIVKKLGRPMTATSANASGARRPYKIEHIFEHLSEKQKSLIDLVIDAGELPQNEPSTVIDTTLSTPTTLRAGEIKFETTTELTSNSEAETKKIAQTLMLQRWDEIKDSGLVIGLDGALGAGKTVFAKGVGEFLKIEDEITSPTYSYLEEYEFERHGVQGKLFHLDLWKVESEAELAELQIEKLLGPNHVLVIEWLHEFKSQIEKLADPHLLRILIEENENHSRQIKFEHDN